MTATVPELEHIIYPLEDAVLLSRIAAFVEAHREHAGLVGPDGDRVDLSDEIYGVLVEVLDVLRPGRAVTVAPQATRLATVEAASLLGISRPTLVKLLESGVIPYEQPGRHRRVRLVDVLAYRDRRGDERRTALDALPRDAVTTAWTRPLPATTGKPSARHVGTPLQSEPTRRAARCLRARPRRTDRHAVAARRSRAVHTPVVPSDPQRSHPGRHQSPPRTRPRTCPSSLPTERLRSHRWS